MTMTRPIHPQAVPGQPQALRWITQVELPPGEVTTAPGTLGPLLEYGVLTKVFVERSGVWTWLATQHTWAEHGPRIRDAITAALDLDGWQIKENSAELLGLIAHDVLTGELAGIITSHGGEISVASVSDSSLLLDFGGTCIDCPSAGTTLHDRIEHAVRKRYPGLVSIDRVARKDNTGWLNLPRFSR